VSFPISFCQSGVSIGRLRGDGGGVEEGEAGMSCQLSSGVSCLAPVKRAFGGAEFHFLVLILLRIAREELSPFVASFNWYVCGRSSLEPLFLF